ncbi:MAG: glycosyltransferase [Gammaproteobacteria bacterium]|nr:glycosyltransferase [Gammaproteobacteria bacterium]
MPDRDPSVFRVVHVVPSLDVAGGGPARSVVRLARAQQRLGAQVAVITGEAEQGDEDSSSEVDFSQLEIHRCRHLPLPFELPSAQMLRVLKGEISAADLVHLHSLWNGTVTSAARIARKLRVPYVISPRGMLDPEAVRQKRSFKRLFRALVDGATSDGAAGFHFLTQYELETAVWPPRAGQRTAIIPNGIEVDAVRRAAEADPADLFHHGGPNLLYLGRLHATKGLGLQLDALARLQAQGVDARLYFIGPDDGEASRLKQRVRAAGLQHRVSILAPVYSDSRFGLLKAADCVLLTSLFEGNSVSAMETMAVGGVLIASDTTHLDDAARHDAAVVVARDEKALAEAISRVLENPELAQSIRRAAIAYARSELESAVIARRMLSFYDEVLGITFAYGARA